MLKNCRMQLGTHPLKPSKQAHKPSNCESVAAVFDQLDQIGSKSAWLARLRTRALNKQLGWKADVESYLQGLEAAGAITPAEVAECNQKLIGCGSGPGWGRYFVVPVVGIVLVAAAALMSRLLAYDEVDLYLMGAVIGIAGGFWASTKPWLERRNDPDLTWERRFMIVACALITPFLTFFIAAIVGEVMQHEAIKSFEADRKAFLSNPDGFPWLRKFAAEQYGKQVILGNASKSWAYTSLNLPNASPAYMIASPGYCDLSISPLNVSRKFSTIAKVDDTQWMQGVMMHEFAHCLDFSRDMPGFVQGMIGTHTLAPADSAKVHDIQSYLDAADTEASQLWREAVADTFAVGFWRLTAPAAAKNLVGNLRSKRLEAHLDTTHATICWINYADKAPLPPTTADLFKWADQLRSEAPCELPNPK